MVDPTEPRFFKSAVGDLDGDGDVDVFTARTSADADRVYLNELRKTTLARDAFRGAQIGGTLEDVVGVPEPSTISLAAIGLLSLLCRGRQTGR